MGVDVPKQFLTTHHQMMKDDFLELGHGNMIAMMNIWRVQKDVCNILQTSLPL